MILVTKKTGKKKGIETQIRIDTEIARKLKILAAIRGEKMTDILNQITVGAVEKMYKEAVEGLNTGTP